MALVRAHPARRTLNDLTVVSLRRPGRRAAVAPPARCAGWSAAFVSLDSIPLEPHFRAARQAGASRLTELDEGMLQWGLLRGGAPAAVPADARRARLRRACGSTRSCARSARRTTTARSWSPCRRSRLDVALVHLNRADAHGNAQFLGPDPYFDDLFCMAADAAPTSPCEQIVRPPELPATGRSQRLLINRTMVHGVVEAPNGAHFTTCVPDYGRDEEFQREYAGRGRQPGGVGRVPRRVPGRRRGGLPAAVTVCEAT